MRTLKSMATITVRFPTDEEEDLLRRFIVNRNYLQAVSSFITTTYGKREKLYRGLRATVEAMPQYRRIQRGQADVEEVRRFLTLAWTSEIQLHLPAIMGSTSMLTFANTWAPVHGLLRRFRHASSLVRGEWNGRGCRRPHRDSADDLQADRAARPLPGTLESFGRRLPDA